MTRRHRRWHRWAWIVLPLVIGALVLASWIARDAAANRLAEPPGVTRSSR